MICDHFLDGFKVATFFTALFFSIILSLSQSILYKFTTNKK
jgi:putative membrane protein